MDAVVVETILKPFVLLPGILVLALFLGGVWGLLKGRLGRSLAYLAAAALLWVLAIPPVADLVQRPLEAGLSVPERPAGDVLVLLGGDILEKSPDFSGTGTPSEGTWGRLVTTARLQQRLGVPVIVSGDRGASRNESTGEVCRRILVDLGVDPDRILLEGDSRDSIEKALYSKAICDERGLRRPILVASAGQMKRSLLSFQKVGMNATAYPCGFRTWEGKKYFWTDYLPHGFEPLSAAVREHLELLLYRHAY
jgi:uncharacterized SAM-binding protein YcdF (DUF218 family)